MKMRTLLSVSPVHRALPGASTWKSRGLRLEAGPSFFGEMENVPVEIGRYRLSKTLGIGAFGKVKCEESPTCFRFTCGRSQHSFGTSSTLCPQRRTFQQLDDFVLGMCSGTQQVCHLGR